ncbi:MmcQ/YjbR family DNA-binding protein [Streptomyces reniochalinae]|uniref:MmcQ/YjbR family DNA-binding protein n=1 Tax=Streptomyces reniochalinae TaxID=2250578 RepID=A0A367E9K6_9ACTN|nr:MmcQ/YjbR family DNA-binding protein [Streptomyces reniochalinae]RCG14718.1 MmcQ/YjbR family DNA-binding protein [Streptomyces reniochalinae]
MTPEELRACCLGQNDAWEDFPFPANPGLSTFKVKKRIFAFSSLDEAPLLVSLKCEPEIALRLRETYPAVRPGRHLNKRHWNTVTLDGSLPDRAVREMVEDSWDLVVAGLPRWERLRLGGG